jgi:hypothetical protein
VVPARRYERSEHYQFGYSLRAVTKTLEGVVSSLCLLRQVSSVSSRNRRNEHRPGAESDVDGFCEFLAG